MVLIATEVELLKTELRAIDLCHRMFEDNPQPDAIDYAACAVRLLRRKQVIMELENIARRN
jgi:hypothetical protein